MKHFLESYATIDEKARITGVALIPRISRNNNLYTKKELARFNNVTVPLNWEHNPSRKIGEVTFRYNQDLETVYYEGEITDEAAANLARNKMLFTSIEADPTEMKEICNAPNDCFAMPFGLTPKALALTETPGVPETSVQVIESYINKIKECESDHEYEKKYANNKTLNNEDHIRKLLDEQSRGEPNDDCISRKVSIIKDEHPDWNQDKTVAVAISMCSESEIKQAFTESLGIKQFCGCCGEVKKKLNK